MEYDFYTWRKVKIWKKNSFLIEAESQDEAIKKAKELFNNDKLDCDLWSAQPGVIKARWVETEYGEDEYPVDYWDEGKPTYELWFDDIVDCNDPDDPDYVQELITDNTPIEILRDNLIDNLLGGVD